MSLKVAVIDAQPVFRVGLRTVLAAEEGLLVVAEVDGTAALNAAERDVVVLDVGAAAPDGLAATRELLRRDPALRVLGLSLVAEESAVADAMAAGALGVYAKTQPAADLVEAVRTVAEGKRYFPPSVSAAAIESRLRRRRSGPLGILSAREREVFDLLVQGYTNDDASKQLHISKRTVETHRSRILKKLGAHSAVDLIRIAARCGALP